MNCHETELAIVEQGAEAPAAVRDHLRGCHACRQFAALHESLLAGGTPGPEPGAELDGLVRAAARRRLVPGWRLFSGPGLLSVAAAASVVAAAVVWVLAERQRLSPSDGGGGSAAIASAVEGGQAWAGAQADLATIEDGLDAAVAELGGLAPSVPGGEDEGLDGWDPLLELEFDVYFESQNLRPAGG